MTNPFNVTIIIPSYNGASRITNTISAVINQTITPSEIIVVIDGSVDDTEYKLETFKKEEKIVTISHPNSGRAATRNKGAKYAKGDLLIFCDDDMRPARDSIEKHVQFHKNIQGGICGGNQLEDDDLMQTDIQRYKAYLSKIWTSKYDDGINKLSASNLFLTASNMSLSKHLFQKLGGFNETLTDAEDYEFAVRALSSNIPIYFDKSNVAWHDDFITCRKYIHRQREYALASDRLNTIIPKKYQRNDPETKMIFIKKVIYKIFSTPIIVQWIDNDKLIWLPRFLRYKIYEVTIFALGKIYVRNPM